MIVMLTPGAGDDLFLSSTEPLRVSSAGGHCNKLCEGLIVERRKERTKGKKERKYYRSNRERCFVRVSSIWCFKMNDSSEDVPEHEHRVLRGVWQPRTVEPKDRIDPFQPAPKDRLVRCFVVKDSVSNAFCLFLQLTSQLSITNKGKFLLAAREISHVSRSEFSVWDDLDEISEDSEFLIGKMVSNLSRTEYVLYDLRQCGNREAYSGCFRPHHGVQPGSTRVLDVHYNVSLGKPQQFRSVIRTVVLDGSKNGHVRFIQAPDSRRNPVFPEESDSEYSGKSKSSGTLSAGSQAQASEVSMEKSASWAGRDQPKLGETVGQSKSDAGKKYMQLSSESKQSVQKGSKEDPDVDGHLILKTKEYEWDDDLKIYYAKFNGRDNVQGSSKNFQMVMGNVSPKENDEALLQFGEVSSELYFMDYAYPLSAFQAFGICLTRLD